MKQKSFIIEGRLKQRRSIPSHSSPPDIATATLTLLEDFQILDREWASTANDDINAQRRLWFCVLSAVQFFLSTQRQGSPTISAFIDALRNINDGVASEKRLTPLMRISKEKPLAENFARAQVIAAINKAPPDRWQDLVLVGAAHLKQTPKQVHNLVKNYNNSLIKSRTLYQMVEELERQIADGRGPDLDALREARLLS